jgi:hypothetical protein
MPCDGTEPNHIAREAGVTGKAVRDWLRATYGDERPGSGGRWQLRHEQVVRALERFGVTAGSRLGAMGGTRPPKDSTAQPASGRSASDERYVMDLVADLLGEEPSLQHRFPWLRGDAGRTLPVDAYFPNHDLVVEYRERQHLAERPDTFKMWDRKPTASGIPRREQRAKYDKLREAEIPRHGIRLVIVNAGDLAVDARGRLRRNRESDVRAIRRVLGFTWRSGASK